MLLRVKALSKIEVILKADVCHALPDPPPPALTVFQFSIK